MLEFPECKRSAECKQFINAAISFNANPSRLRKEFPIEMTTERCWSPNGKIYMFALRDSFEFVSTLSQYSPDNSLPFGYLEVPRRLKRSKIAVLDGVIYLTGGVTRCEIPFSEEVSVATVDVCLPETNKLMSAPPMNIERDEHGCCSHEGKLYVVGGIKTREVVHYEDYYDEEEMEYYQYVQPERHEYLKSCETFDKTCQQWDFTAPLITERHLLAVVSCNGCVYALGGMKRRETIKSVERYQPNKDSWEMVVPMLSPRYGHGAVAYRSKIFIFGGVGHGKFLNSCEVYDSVHNQFSMLPSMTVSRGSFGVAMSGCSIYCIGGTSNSQTKLQSVEVFDIISRTWSEGEPMHEKGEVVCATIYEK